jgi:DNA-binding NarL/FixJ family response regulator
MLHLAPGKFLIDPGFMDWYTSLIGSNGHLTGEQILLTPREQEIVALLDKGVSPEEIAERLSIAIATVRRQMANIAAKGKQKR